MIAMVKEEQLQRLAEECLHISERTEDARTASDMLRLSSSARDADDAHLARTRAAVPLAIRSLSRHHQDRPGCRTDREIVDR
jgi:hypothetical protein